MSHRQILPCRGLAVTSLELTLVAMKVGLGRLGMRCPDGISTRPMAGEDASIRSQNTDVAGLLEVVLLPSLAASSRPQGR